MKSIRCCRWLRRLGAGSQVPLSILDDTWGKGKKGCKIMCTQRLRISASSSAGRVAAQRHELGYDTVYTVRLDSGAQRERAANNDGQYIEIMEKIQALARRSSELQSRINHNSDRQSQGKGELAAQLIKVTGTESHALGAVAAFFEKVLSQSPLVAINTAVNRLQDSGSAEA